MTTAQNQQTRTWSYDYTWHLRAFLRSGICIFYSMASIYQDDNWCFTLLLKEQRMDTEQRAGMLGHSSLKWINFFYSWTSMKVPAPFWYSHLVVKKSLLLRFGFQKHAKSSFGKKKNTEGPKEGFLEKRTFAMGFEEWIGVCQTTIRYPKVLNAGFSPFVCEGSEQGRDTDKIPFVTSSWRPSLFLQ